MALGCGHSVAVPGSGQLGAPVKHSTRSALVSGNWRGCEDAPAAYRKGLTGIIPGCFTVFYNVKRA